MNAHIIDLTATHFKRDLRRSSEANFRVTHVSPVLLFTSLGIYLLTAWEAEMNADDGSSLCCLAGSVTSRAICGTVGSVRICAMYEHADVVCQHFDGQAVAKTCRTIAVLRMSCRK